MQVFIAVFQHLREHKRAKKLCKARFKRLQNEEKFFVRLNANGN
jgi:hypothetical protein